MTAPYYTDDHVTLWHGDAAATLATLPDASIDCIVTSPPYFGLRDYGVDGQVGAEGSPAEFVAALTAVFHESRRVLADDGTLWLNLGDSYVNAGGAGTQGRTGQRASRTFTAERRPARGDLPAKNLLGIPWRVAFALQDDGWILRKDIIWAKPNAMPESVTDRPSSCKEYLFLFSKRPAYWFDLDPIREEHAPAGLARRKYAFNVSDAQRAGSNPVLNGAGKRPANELGKNPGDVWTIPTQPFPGAHFATMPSALAERCILAGCKPGGVVLDPFSGSGTTGMAAAKHGRRYVGIELNEEYLELSLRTRLAQGVLDFGEAS